MRVKLKKYVRRRHEHLLRTYFINFVLAEPKVFYCSISAGSNIPHHTDKSHYSAREPIGSHGFSTIGS